jgi:transposase
MKAHQWNSGKGNMSEETFLHYVNTMGIMQAQWVAKYYGVALNTVKQWITNYMERMK